MLVCVSYSFVRINKVVLNRSQKSLTVQFAISCSCRLLISKYKNKDFYNKVTHIILRFRIVPLSSGYFGSGHGAIFLGNPRCNGIENNILDCYSDSSYTISACPSHQFAGVDCSRGNQRNINT